MHNGLSPNRESEKPTPPRIRCAVYTRKSTEEGLDQDFNSLDAQREAAEAYIQSQKNLGWTLIPNQYNDGGFSGGSLDRPALQRLLQDIEAGRVDCVVVYKVDRLSRSLLDFARLVDQFDQRSVSFVSVTQQFNTTTSLGRLTLNILLSFAQFERDIIGERTRDKMSAARRKGKWVGGTPVLGYDVDPGGGRLVINEKEARRVREIFELYRNHRSFSVVVAELERRNWRTKSWTSNGGVKHLGRPFTKASLRRLLINAIYAGKVEHKGAIYAGEHPAIVEPTVWESINAELRARHREQYSKRVKQNALLAGLLYCASCDCLMIATYTAKRGLRYRYYVCQTARQKGWASCPTKSVPAGIIEDSVRARLHPTIDDNGQAQQRLQVPEADEGITRQDDSELIRDIVERIKYDGTTGAVSVQLRERA
jgi:site-specific DNA recombinase